MKPRPLSVTWRVRLLNGLLSAVVLTILVAAAQARIRAVLYESVDSSLRDQAADIARHPFGDPFHHGGDGHGGFFGQPPANQGDDDPQRRGPNQGDFGRDNPMPGFEGRDKPDPNEQRPRPRREPPPPRFGTISLRPVRVVPLDGRRGPQPWSADGLAKAKQSHDDIREETDADGERLRVYSLFVPSQTEHGALVVQTAATMAATDAALREIQTALYGLLLPLAIGVGLGGAFLTDFALSPVRRLTQAVAKMEGTDLSERLPAPGGGDTFDQLVALLNALLARLDAAFARQKRFTADASHELRTPLAVIKSATSLLLENPESLTPLQERALRRADLSADRANQLVSDLLLLARTETGTMPVRLVRTSVKMMVGEAVSEIESTQSAPYATLLVTLPDNLEVSTDPAHVRRLLINLATNALRHTPATGTVTIAARTVGDAWELSVRDTGEGIEPGELARLGEPFYRPDASRSREQGGTGLGLALCKGIVAALHGTLQIESEVGVGTTVTVRLPFPDHTDN